MDREILKEIFRKNISKKTNNEAMDIRYQTSGKASMEMSAPKMAVKPKMITIK